MLIRNRRRLVPRSCLADVHGLKLFSFLRDTNSKATHYLLSSAATIADGDHKSALCFGIAAVPTIWYKFAMFRRNCAISLVTRAFILRM